MIHQHFIRLLIFLYAILFLACNRNDPETHPVGSYQPMIFTAKIFLADSNLIITKPTQVHTSKIKTIIASKPQITTLLNISRTVGKLKTVTAGKPVINFPGKNGFALPKRILIKEKPHFQGAFKTSISRGYSYKENNPFSFASFGKNQGLNSSIVSCLLQDNSGKSGWELHWV